MTYRSAVWVEGEPEGAKACGKAAEFWRTTLGGLWAAIRGKRICKAWPIRPEDNPVVVARRCERRGKRAR